MTIKSFKKRHLLDSANNGEKARKVMKTEINNFISYAREIWSMDKDKTISITTEDRDFREFFGCGALVALKVWGLLLDNFFIPDGACLYHLL